MCLNLLALLMRRGCCCCLDNRDGDDSYAPAVFDVSLSVGCELCVDEEVVIPLAAAVRAAPLVARKKDEVRARG